MDKRLLFSFALITVYCNVLHAGHKNENELAKLTYFAGLSVDSALVLAGCERDHELDEPDERDTSNLWEDDEEEHEVAPHALTLSDFYGEDSKETIHYNSSESDFTYDETDNWSVITQELISSDEDDCPDDDENYEAYLARLRKQELSSSEDGYCSDDEQNSSNESDDDFNALFYSNKLKKHKKRMRDRCDKMKRTQAHNHYTGDRTLKRTTTTYKTLRNLVKNQHKKRKWAPKGMRKDTRNAKSAHVLRLVHTHKVRLKKFAVV